MLDIEFFFWVIFPSTVAILLTWMILLRILAVLNGLAAKLKEMEKKTIEFESRQMDFVSPGRKRNRTMHGDD